MLWHCKISINPNRYGKLIAAYNEYAAMRIPLFSFEVFPYILYYLVLILAAFHSMDKTIHYYTCKLHIFYNISYHQSNYLQHQMIFSCSEFFHICFCKPMGNKRTKNMRLLKLLDIHEGREYAYINRYKYIKFLTYPTVRISESLGLC